MVFGTDHDDAQACRNFFDDGVCKQECPAMQRYNQLTYSWETNPEGKYAYGATCVKTCPEHLLKDNGACVKMCPERKKVSHCLSVCLSVSVRPSVRPSVSLSLGLSAV